MSTWRQPAPVVFRHVCGWTGYDANGDARCVADYYHSWSGKDRRGDHHPAVMRDGCGDVLHGDPPEVDALAIARAVWGDDLITPGEVA